MFGEQWEPENVNSVLTRRLIAVLKKTGSRIVAEAKELTTDLKRVVDVMEQSNYFLVDGESVINKNSNETSELDNHSGRYTEEKDLILTTPAYFKVSTTTEEESNDILEQTDKIQTNPESGNLNTTEANFNIEATTFIPEFLEETEEADIESTTSTQSETIDKVFETQTSLAESEQQPEESHPTPNIRPSSAFNSLLLKKIQEVSETMKKTGASLEFSTSWKTIPNNEENWKWKVFNHHIEKRQAEEVTTDATETETEVSAHQQLQPEKMDQCVSRWELEQHQIAEKQHLESLEKELEKMEELIKVLKEQQRILDNMSELDEKYYEFLNNSMKASNIAEQHRLVQLLEVLNSRLSSNLTDENDLRPIEDEVLRLKHEIVEMKLMIEEFPNRSDEIERKLSKALDKQDMEISKIKKTLWKLTNAGMGKLNGSTPRAATDITDLLTPSEMEERIEIVQEELDEILAGKQYTKLYLLFMLREVDHLKGLVNESLSLLQMQDDLEDSNQLKDQEQHLVNLDATIWDVLKNGVTPKTSLSKDVVIVGQPLHHLSVPHLGHSVAIPRIVKQKAASNSSKNEHETSKEKAQSRSSDSDDIMKFLRQLNDDPSTTESPTESSTITIVLTDDEADLRNKLLGIEKFLKKEINKKRREKDKEAHLDSILHNVDSLQDRSLSDDKDEIMLVLLKRLLQEMDRSGREIEESDTDRELKKLAAAINKLRPKDNDFNFDTPNKNDISAAQFQLMLNRFLAQQNVQRPMALPSFTPQQMDFLIRRFGPQAAAFANNRFGQQFPTGRDIDFSQNFVRPPQPQPSSPFAFSAPPQPIPAQPQDNFFRDYPPNAPPPYANYPGANQQQLDTYPEQTNVDAGPYAKQKIDDLKQQIFALQNAISTLDNPNYVKKPEDEETIRQLEKQINKLKNIVGGLNQFSGDGAIADGSFRGGNAFETPVDVHVNPNGGEDKPRVRRDVSDEAEAEKFMENTANFLRNFMPTEETPRALHQRSSGSYKDLHQKLLDLEKQLGRMV